ncbi:PBP1b-binding outer membrane lipoprotein LpoB [Elusimicrobium simillimum]|uniref:hypothetical protein n=1 Tax=Elusimicrobium simillimum TaxID=3143438 RepID=UPI003C6FA993
MKRNSILFLILTATLFFAACEKKEEPKQKQENALKSYHSNLKNAVDSAELYNINSLT